MGIILWRNKLVFYDYYYVVMIFDAFFLLDAMKSFFLSPHSLTLASCFFDEERNVLFTKLYVHRAVSVLCIYRRKRSTQRLR